MLRLRDGEVNPVAEGMYAQETASAVRRSPHRFSRPASGTTGTSRRATTLTLPGSVFPAIVSGRSPVGRPGRHCAQAESLHSWRLAVSCAPTRRLSWAEPPSAPWTRLAIWRHGRCSHLPSRKASTAPRRRGLYRRFSQNSRLGRLMIRWRTRQIVPQTVLCACPRPRPPAISTQRARA